MIVTDTKILRKKSRRVWSVGAAARAVFERLALEADALKAAGIAAPQIGVRKRLIVVRTAYGLLPMANPEIVNRSDMSVTEAEFCLSLPGEMAYVTRSQWVDVEYLDIDDERTRHRFYGAEARCVQHEIDHLDGILMTDHGPMKSDA